MYHFNGRPPQDAFDALKAKLTEALRTSVGLPSLRLRFKSGDGCRTHSLGAASPLDIFSNGAVNLRIHKQ